MNGRRMITNLRHRDGRMICIHDDSAFGLHSAAFIINGTGPTCIQWIVRPATVAEYIEMLERQGFERDPDMIGVGAILGMSLINDPNTPTSFWMAEDP